MNVVAKRLTVLISDELYAEMMVVKGKNETLTITDLVRAALRLLIWYYRQQEEGFTVSACKKESGREIIRKITVQRTKSA